MERQQEFVLRTLEERDIRFVRLWFTDVLGVLKSVAVAPAELEGAFDEGIGFDGSAIEGFARVYEADVLAKPDGQKFAKALTGAWYELLGLMSAKSPATDKVLASIAEGSKDTLDSYKEQLSTTKMFYTPQSAVEFGASPDLKKKMDLVRQFCFDHGLLGANTKSVDDVAIRYPDSSVQGKADHVRLVFDLSYMKMAAEGKL